MFTQKFPMATFTNTHTSSHKSKYSCPNVYKVILGSIFFVAFFFGMSTSYAQNKKEQIVLLKERVDSFSHAFDSLSVVLTQEKKDNKNRIAELEASLEEQRKTVATLTSKNEALEKNVKELENSLTNNKEKLSTVSTELDQTKNELQTAKRTIKEKEQLLADKTKEAEGYKSKLTGSSNTGTAVSQTKPEEEAEDAIPNLDGIYQWTLNEKPVKAKDLVKSKYPEYLTFSLFDGEYSYIIMAPSLAEVSKNKVSALLEKGLAIKSTFDFDGENLKIYSDGSEINMLYEKSKKIFVNPNSSVNLKLVFKKGI